MRQRIGLWALLAALAFVSLGAWAFGGLDAAAWASGGFAAGLGALLPAWLAMCWALRHGSAPVIGHEWDG